MNEDQSRTAAQAAEHEWGDIKWFDGYGSPIDLQRMTLEKATHPADDPDGQLWPAAVDGPALHDDELIAEEMFEATPYYVFADCNEDTKAALQEWLDLSHIEVRDPETFWFQDGFIDFVLDGYNREQERMQRRAEREVTRGLTNEEYEQLF